MGEKREPIVIDVEPEELHIDYSPREPTQLEGMAERLNQVAVAEVEGNLQDFIRQAAPFVAVGVAVYYGAPFLKRFIEGK